MTNIATANGVKGGPIVSTGTIELDVEGLPEDTTPDLTADYVPTYDASAAGHRKVKLQNIGGTQVSPQSGNFTAGAAPNTVYVVSETADATLPSAASMPSGFRAAVKNATDGKGVRILPDGSDTIDELSAYRVPGREMVEVIRTAAGAWTVTRTPNHMVGEIIPWTSNTLPAGGWAWCNGQALSRTDYAGLFAVTSTTFGSGNGSTTFNVPDLRGRVPAGVDAMGNASAANRLTSAATGFGANATLAASNGSQSHTLTANEMPNHNHPGAANVESPGAPATSGYNRNVGQLWYSGGLGDSSNSGTAQTAAQGGSAAHPNVQPTLILNYAIKT